LLLALLLLCACGTRTGLLIGEEDGAVRDSAPRVRDSGPSPADGDTPGCVCSGEAVLAGATASPTAIAVDRTHVYWASAPGGCGEGTIRRIPKCGGPVEVLADDEPNPRAIALDDDRVYYYDACGSGLLRSVPKDGGPVQTYTISVMDSGRALAVGGDQIYFSDYGLLRIPKTGGMQAVIESDHYVYAVAADARGVFWGGPARASSSYVVYAYHPGDTEPTVLTRPDDLSNHLTIDDDFVYYFARSNIWRVPRGGGEATPVVVSRVGHRMAVDESSVYWTYGFSGSGGYTVYKAPKAGGGEAVEIGSGDGAYVDIAVDERCVYLADLYGDEVRSLPK
jgi:hypothetical protein